MVNFCLNDVNFRLVRPSKQGNNKKKLQGCISKGEGGARVDVPVMFFRAKCNFIIIVLYFIKLYLLLKACYVQNLLYKKPGAGIQLPLYNSIPNGRF